MWTFSRPAATVKQLGLLAMLLVEAAKAVQAQDIYYGQLQETAVHFKEDNSTGKVDAAHADGLDDHPKQYHLLLKTGELKLLAFPKPPVQLPRSGSWVMVRTSSAEACSGAAEFSWSAVVLCVASMMAHEEAPRDSVAAGQPRGRIIFKALVMQLQVCGQGPATTPDKLQGALFDGLPQSQAETVQGMFKSCSYGNADFSKSMGSQVITTTVSIPCSGTTPWGMPYDSMTCPFTEWSDVANNYIKTSLGYHWEDFKYKIYVVPPGDLCSWGGMGWVGCKTDCRAWISGDLWQYPATWLHELGHNLYMNHAGSYQPPRSGGPPTFVAYKDDSGAMGHCCSTRCFNAPHSLQVGWSKPVGVLHKGNMAAGQWYSYVLPPANGGRTQKNMLRIRGDWVKQAAGYNLFIEYRKAQKYDSGLLVSTRNKVTIHSTPLGDAMPLTTLEGTVGENQIMHETRLRSSLAVWVGSRTADGIQVNVCRPESSTERSCRDGKDNDCDGYTDLEDPDCSPGYSGRRLLQQSNNSSQLLGFASYVVS